MNNDRSFARKIISALKRFLVYLEIFSFKSNIFARVRVCLDNIMQSHLC